MSRGALKVIDIADCPILVFEVSRRTDGNLPPDEVPGGTGKRYWIRRNFDKTIQRASGSRALIKIN